MSNENEKPKWTQPPWEIAASRNGFDIDLHGERYSYRDGEVVTWFATVKGNATSTEVTAANAQLMIAAPDLFAACQAFVTAWDKCLQLEKTDEALRLARAAIAKALASTASKERE